MRGWLAIALLVFVPALVAAPRRDGGPPPPAATNQTIHVIDFRVPQYDEQGNMTSMLKGKEANVYPDRIAEITEVLVEIFKTVATGRVTEARITSPKCFYQAEKNIAIGDGQLRMVHDTMIVTGTNYVIDAKGQRLQINEGAKVVLKGVQSRSLEEAMGIKTNGTPSRATAKDGKVKP